MSELLIRLIGYRPDGEVARELRVAAKSAIMLAVVAFAAASVYLTHREPAPTRENIDILSTLDAFTKRATLDGGNTIPAFMASPGRIGRLSSTGTVNDPVTTLDEGELGRGFCSPSIADLVRHEYPGYYDRWSDDALERAVIERHPDYGSRYCMLSSRLDAGADEVIKYELKQRSALGWIAVWTTILLLTGLFAVACINAYYRVIVPAGSGFSRHPVAA